MKRIIAAPLFIIFALALLVPYGVEAQDANDPCLEAVPDFALQARIGRGRVYDMALSPDDTWLAVASGSEVWIYDAADLTMRQVIPLDSAASAVDWSPDGAQIAVGDVDGVHIWDVAGTSPAHLWSVIIPDVTHITWSPDGARLAVLNLGDVSMYPDGTEYYDLRVIDAASQHEQRIMERIIRNPDRAVWSPDGTRLLFTGSYIYEMEELIMDFVPAAGYAVIWHAEDGRQQILTPTGPAYHDVHGVGWSPDGSQIALSIYLSQGEDEAEVQIWDATTFDVVETIPEAEGHPVWSSDGTALGIGAGTAYYQKVRLYRNERLALYGQWVTAFALNTDASHIYVYDMFQRGLLVVYDVNGSALAQTTTHGATVVQVKWSSGGSYLAVVRAGASDDQQIVAIYDVQGQYVTTINPSRYPRQMAFAPDETRLAMAHSDGLSIWTRELPGEPLLELTGEDVFWMAWSPDGTQLATISDAGNVRVWDADTGEELQLFPTTIDRLDGTANALDSRIFWSEAAGLRWLMSDWDRIIRVFGPEQVEALAVVGDTDSVLGTSPEFLENGDVIYIPYRGEATVFDVESATVAATYPNAAGDVRWSASGGCYGYFGGGAAVIKATVDSEILNMLELPFWAKSGWHGGVHWSPDGQRVAIILEDGTVLVWGVAL